MRSLLFLLPLLPLLAACPKQPGAVVDAAPSEARQPGWKTVSGHACYEPPTFTGLEGTARKAARGDALSEASKRWRGNVDPDFVLADDLVEKLENAMLTNPARIERLLPADYERCVRWSRGELSLEDYQAWYRETLGQLGLEDCSHPKFDRIAQYLEVNRRWQIEVPICRDEEYIIGTQGGHYTIEDKGDTPDTVWITVQGDLKQPVTDAAYPCHREGCFKGQLVGRFLDRSGKETIFPIGEQTSFRAPSHGALTFGINDVELYDNRFQTREQVTEYLLIEIRPSPAGADE